MSMNRRAGRRPGRGASSGIVWTPKAISGLALWLRADMGITLNGGTVSQWNDQSGTGDNNKHVTQAVPGQQPTYNTTDAGYNSKPSLSFDAVDDYLGAAGNWATPAPAVATWFVVGEIGAAGAARFMFGNVGASTYEFWGSGVSDINWFEATAVLTTTLGDTTNKHVYCIEANGANSKIYQDSNTASVTGNAGSATGAKIDVVGPAGKLGGKIAELIGYSGVLPASDRANVMAYIGSRYAITIT